MRNLGMTKSAPALIAAVALVAAGCSSTSDDGVTSGSGSGAVSSDVTTLPQTNSSGVSGSSSGPDAGSSVTNEAPGSESTNQAPPDESTAMTNSSVTGTSGKPAEAKNNDLRAAATLALDSGPDGGVLYSIESEEDDTQWEVKVVDSDGAKYELKISRHGSEVLGQKEKDTSASDRDKYLKRVQSAEVDYSGAIDALEGQVPGGRVDELELDDADDGTLVWEADVYDSDGTKHELDVDAVTGELHSS